MNILLTNDDGFDAEGIIAIRAALEKNHNVYVVAPEKNCSGLSASISYMKEIEISKESENLYIVKGTPADCAYIGLLNLLNNEIDVLVSGINLGANIGNDVLYSGTVGAALGGRKLKFPPIAISSCECIPKSLEFIANKSCELVELVTSFKKQEISNKVVNINFPDIDEESYKGIKVVPIAKRDTPPTPNILKDNTNIQSFKYAASGAPIEEDFLTDAEAVKRGYVSISILDYELLDPNFNCFELENFINEQS
ncbi:MAG: 5'/3'-nucleotidase SurE [Gammaproteobacteria bacterium]